MNNALAQYLGSNARCTEGWLVNVRNKSYVEKET